MFPEAQALNRGGHVLEELVKTCRANDVTDLIILHEHRGNPDGMVVCHLPYGPTAYFALSNVVLRHDIPQAGTLSEAFPHLIFHGFSSRLGERVTSILKHLFPVPKDDSKRVMTFANSSDVISFRSVSSCSAFVQVCCISPPFLLISPPSPSLSVSHLQTPRVHKEGQGGGARRSWPAL